MLNWISFRVWSVALFVSLLTSPGVRDSRRLRDKTHPADNYNVQPKSGTTIDLFSTCFSSDIASSARFSPLAR